MLMQAISSRHRGAQTLAKLFMGMGNCCALRVSLGAFKDKHFFNQVRKKDARIFGCAFNIETHKPIVNYSF